MTGVEQPFIAFVLPEYESIEVGGKLAVISEA